ncbi:MAG: T9SS type A sorting domain-containing protein [Crocinitomicaceae bacterium]|nr:T9SS type A sorting domain-containing protein [Crocinitomicaceae bacterium]
MKKITILPVFLALFAIESIAQTTDLYVGASTDFYAKGIVSLHGNATIADGQKFTSDATAKILAKGNVAVTTNPVVIAGAFTFTNAAEKNISGSVQSKAIYMTASSALNLNGTGDLKATDSLTLNGIIKTNANAVELGSSPTNVGLLVHTSGYINGNMKRWFGAATVSNVLFPLGASTHLVPAKISYTTAPSVGGTLLGKHTMNTANPLIASSLVDGSSTVDKVSEMNIWQFDAANGLTGGDYAMELTSNLVYGISDVTELRIVKRATSSDPWSLNGTHVAGAGTNATPIVKRSAMSGFSQFAIGSTAANPLPVTLTYLNADCSDNGVEVKWQTASENNSDYYAVERSLDGQNWNEIAVKTAAGNSTTLLNYSIVDEDRMAGTRYYRLNQVDKNGASVVYGPISSSCSFNEMAVTVFPNPASSNVTIAVQTPTAGMVELNIHAMDGKLIAHSSAMIESGTTALPFNLEGNKSGVYLVSITLNGQTNIEKLIIQ